MLKAGNDKLAVRALIGLTGLVVMIGPAWWIGRPGAVVIPWLIAAVVLHIVYQLVLITAYAAADFSVSFPIARGIAPVATTILAFVAFGERLSLPVSAGIVAIGMGVASLALRGRSGARGLVAAVTAGLLTAAYTVVDARGVRAGTSALEFIAWFFVLDGVAMPLILLAARRERTVAVLRADGWLGVGAGIVALTSFGGTLFALGLAPTGVVSGLRETSVVVAVLIGTRWLGEPVTRVKLASAALVALGAGAIAGFA